jgi:hypothetical protein
MISQSDVAGRLRLLRYGLVVLVITTFLVSLFVPYVYLSGLGMVSGVEVSITDFLKLSLIVTGAIAVLSVIIYFIYRAILQRSYGQAGQ